MGELIADGEIALVVNTPRGGQGARTDGYEIRAAAIRAGIPCITTIEAGRGRGRRDRRRRGRRARALQDQGVRTGPRASAFRPGARHSLRLNLRPRFCENRYIRGFACNKRENGVKRLQSRPCQTARQRT